MFLFLTNYFSFQSYTCFKILVPLTYHTNKDNLEILIYFPFSNVFVCHDFKMSNWVNNWKLNSSPSTFPLSWGQWVNWLLWAGPPYHSSSQFQYRKPSPITRDLCLFLAIEDLVGRKSWVEVSVGVSLTVTPSATLEASLMRSDWRFADWKRLSWGYNDWEIHGPCLGLIAW